MKPIPIIVASSGESPVESFVNAFRSTAESMKNSLESDEDLRAQIVTQNGEIMQIGTISYAEPNMLIIYGKKEETLATAVVSCHIPELSVSVIKKSSEPQEIGFHAISELYTDEETKSANER